MSQIDRFQLPQIVRNDFISGNVLVEGNDLELARSAVSDVFVNHRLRAAKPQPLRPVQVSYKRFDALAVSYFDYGRELEVEPDLFEDFYLVQIPLQGHSTTRCGSTTVDNIVGMASVLPAQRKVAIHMSQDARKLLVQVDRRKVTQKLEAYLGHQLTRSPDFNLSAHDVVGLNSPMRHAILGLLSIPFESAGLTQGQRMISPAFEDAFLHSLLFDIESDMSPAIHAGAMSSACPKAVRRAEEYIEANLAETICIEDLARAAGVSERSLFDGFNRFRDMTPMRYVKFRRVHKVREQLENADESTSVSSVAFDWGFNHLGRFAKDYANSFGEKPSDTLHRSRK